MAINTSLPVRMVKVNGVDLPMYSEGGGSPSLQSKSATPTESRQTITADPGYDGLSSVDVAAIDSHYVGSAVSRKSSTDLSVSGATVSVPAGYYGTDSSKAVASGSVSNPTASKSAVSNHSISVTPSVSSTAGYIAGGSKTGPAVTVTAAELVSGTLPITGNGEQDVTNYQKVNVNIPFVTYYTGSSAPASSLGSNDDIYLQM